MTRNEIFAQLATPGRANYAPLWRELARQYEEKGELISRDAAMYMATENIYQDYPSARMAGVEVALVREQRLLHAILEVADEEETD